MKLQIRGGTIKVTKVLRAYVDRRLHLVLGRFGDQIGRVTADLSAADDDGGGKRCHIDVYLRRAADVQAEDIDVDMVAAIDRAVGRAGRSLALALERERAWGDGPSRAPAALRPRSGGR
jgi:ribosomal subunit interface protein